MFPLTEPFKNETYSVAGHTCNAAVLVALTCGFVAFAAGNIYSV